MTTAIVLILLFIGVFLLVEYRGLKAEKEALKRKNQWPSATVDRKELDRLLMPDELE
jgi:hypothetical protein